MRILLAAATKLEIDPYITKEKHPELLITGVGIPATLYHLQKKIYREEPYDLIIQAGIGGSFTEDVEPGKVVVVGKDTFGDIGMEEKQHFTSIFNTPFYDKDQFPFEEGWLINRNNLAGSLLLPVVTAITINKISDSLLQKQQLVRSFSAQVESMEGAALHYVCLQENIPFIQIRSISNYVGERDRSKWKMKEAITNLSNELDRLLNRLTK